jgi:adenylate cyclase, class 2
MLQLMQEVEVKYRVHDSRRLFEALRARAVTLSGPVEQDDQAYAPVGWSQGDTKLGITFARLRTEAGRHLFTLKRPIANELSCIEHETEIADRDAMHAALLSMGFSPTTRINKRRMVGNVDGLSVCVDCVDGIGWFLEVETFVSDTSLGAAVQDILDNFVASLGVDLERSTSTYDSLLHAAAV